MINIKATTRTSTVMKKSYELAFTAMAMMLMAQVALAQVSMIKNNDDDSMSLKVGGSEKVIIQTDGRMGVNLNGNKPNATLDVSGTVSATAFVGDGSGLTNLPGGLWTDAGDYIERDGFRIYKTGTTANIANYDTVAVFDKFNGGSLRVGGAPGSNGWYEANVGVGSIGFTKGVASGFNSLAMRGTASGDYSTALGGEFSSSTKALGVESIALGVGTASGDNSVMIGESSTAGSNKSYAIGRNLSISGARSYGFGQNGALTGVDSMLLSVGAGTEGVSLTDSNTIALIGATGGVGIGTVSPLADLHVHKDTGSVGAIISGAATENQVLSFAAATDNVWDIFRLPSTDAVMPNGLVIGGDHSGVGGTSFASLSLDVDGNVGVAGIVPAVALDVSGTLMISNGGEVCDASTEGAIRYTAAGGVMYCDATSWSAMGGGVWNDNTTHVSSNSVTIINNGETMTSAGFDGSFTAGLYYHNDKQSLFFGNPSPGMWNESNVGTETLVIGDSRATGTQSVSIGQWNGASGTRSFSMGRNANNQGDYSFGIGDDITINSGVKNALAVGTSTRVRSSQSMALGTSAIVDTGASYSLSFGKNTLASGTHSFAFGESAKAGGASSYAFGTGVEAAGDYSMIVGLGSSADISGSVVSDSNTLAIVGATNGVGIGTVSPNAALEVSGTVSATVFVGDGSGLTGVGGASALNDLSDGFYSSVNKSMALGVNAMSETAVNNPDNIDVYGNVAIGESALHKVTTDGNFNTAVGYNSGSSLDSGAGNVAIGSDALSGTTGYGSTGNVVVGNSAMSGNANGTYNVVVGADAGDGLNNAVSNILMGYSAATNLGTGLYNIILGDNAADNLTAGSNNIVIGATSVANATGSNQLNIGNFIKASNMGMTGSATFEISDVMVLDAGSDSFGIGKGMNTGLFGDSALYIGNGAGVSTGGGENSVLLGNYAATNATYVGDDVLIGHSVAQSYDSGSGNIIIGANVDVDDANAEYELNIGDFIKASDMRMGVGQAFEISNVLAMSISDDSVAVGTNRKASQLGTDMTFLGSNAGYSLTAGGGEESVLIGSGAAVNATFVAKDVIIGSSAANSYITGENNIVIGMLADVSEANAHNELNIGNTLYGNLLTKAIGVGVVSPTTALEVSGTVSATAFVGDGSGLTGVAGGLWTDNTNYINYEGVRLYKPGTTWDHSFGDTGVYYHADKSAYRIGRQNNGSGDEANVGQYSLGMGDAVIASGLRSFAMGYTSTASGADSFAFGNGSQATGARAIAMGNGARALNSDAIAIGSGTYASNLFSIALGRSTAATQNSAFAVGNGARASGVTSVALGMGTEAKNNYSLATNYQTIASGAQSVAMGRGSQANGITSFAFGEGVIAQGNYSYVIGLDNGISGTTVTDARTMAILGGEVGIGLTSPSVELDVSGSIQYTGNLLDASDRRLKQNIQPIEDGALERMGQVEAVSFEMKDRPGVTELGVIAQDFENIYPELVKTADDEMGTKSVNYIGMIAPMVKAMQELKAEVDELKAQNAEQARLIEELQAK